MRIIRWLLLGFMDKEPAFKVAVWIYGRKTSMNQQVAGVETNRFCLNSALHVFHGNASDKYMCNE